MESLTHSEAEDVLTVEDYGAIRRDHRDRGSRSSKRRSRIRPRAQYRPHGHQDASARPTAGHPGTAPPGAGALPRHDRPDPGRRRGRSPQAARTAGVADLSPDSATSRGTAASMSRSSVTSGPTVVASRETFHPAGAPSPAGRLEAELRAHPRRLPRRPQGSCAVPGGDLGVLQRPVRAGRLPSRADRGRARRDGRGLRVLRGRPSRSPGGTTPGPSRP